MDYITVSMPYPLFEYLYNNVDIQSRHYALMCKERPKKLDVYEPKRLMFLDGVNCFKSADYEYNQKIQSVRKDGQQAKRERNNKNLERRQFNQACAIPGQRLCNVELVQCMGQGQQCTDSKLHEQRQANGAQSRTWGHCDKTIEKLTKITPMASVFRVSDVNRPILDAIQARLNKTSWNKTINAMIPEFIPLLEENAQLKARIEALENELAQKDAELAQIANGLRIAAKYGKSA